MKTLKVKELKEGCIYWCNLSDRKVLVTSIQEKTTELPDGKKVDYTECNAIAYSGNGMYDSVIVWDNMLSLTSNSA